MIVPDHWWLYRTTDDDHYVFSYEFSKVVPCHTHNSHPLSCGRRIIPDNSIKGNFLAKTSSKEYRVRLFDFVFAVLLYNIWRLTDLLLKADVDSDTDYVPVLTAGECV